MLGLRFKWLIPFSLIAYVVYVITVICPDSSRSKLAIHQISCDYLHTKVYPVASPYVDQLSVKYQVLDKQYGLNDKFGFVGDHFNGNYQKVAIAFDSKLKPVLIHYYNELKYQTTVYYHQITSKIITFVEPYTTCAVSKFEESEFYALYKQNDFNIFQTFYDLFKLKSSHINNTINKKIGFLKKEGENLFKIKFDRTPIQKTEDVAGVVKELLHDVESKTSAFLESAKSQASVVESILPEVSEVESVVTSQVSEETEVTSQVSEETEAPSQASENFEASSVGPAPVGSESVDEVTSDGESDQSDDEPLTIYSTSTITVTEDSSSTDGQVALKEEDYELTQDSAETRVNEELIYWENKIKNFLNLSVENLETEMVPVLHLLMDSTVKAISENLTEVQTEIHMRYKEMNEMISKIHKDAEEIQTTNEVPEEYEVPRQIIRDKIKECYDLPETKFKEVEVLLNDINEQILSKYFEIIQETIDIIESFAESSIQEFSSRLANLIEYLQDSSITNKALFVDDALNFRAWKKFRQIKEEIFSTRDQIYNDAYDFKENLSKSTKKPKGLEKWTDYLKNINFHINFLLRDNDEYLRLIRARANVAFQLREGLEKEIAEAKEKLRQEELEREEKLRQEELEREEKRKQEELQRKEKSKQEEQVEEKSQTVPGEEEEYVTVTEVLSDDEEENNSPAEEDNSPAEEDNSPAEVDNSPTEEVKAIPLTEATTLSKTMAPVSHDPLDNDVELDSELDAELDVDLN